MKNLIQYQYTVEVLFTSYLNGKINVSQLIHILKKLESNEREAGNYSEDEGMWFRLFKGDPSVTTIRDLERLLKMTTHPNYEHTRDCMQIGTSLGSKVEIYFS